MDGDSLVSTDQLVPLRDSNGMPLHDGNGKALMVARVPPDDEHLPAAVVEPDVPPARKAPRK